MKKGLFSFLVCIASLALHAQTGWTTNVKGCFCCNGMYNLPTPPVINGTVTILCVDTARYCVSPCPGSEIIWSVSPVVVFTGQGTNCITLKAPFTAPSYTIAVRIQCGDKVVTNRIAVKHSCTKKG